MIPGALYPRMPSAAGVDSTTTSFFVSLASSMVDFGCVISSDCVVAGSVLSTSGVSMFALLTGTCSVAGVDSAAGTTSGIDIVRADVVEYCL